MLTDKTEQLFAELLGTPKHPLNNSQKKLAYEFAAGLFSGRVGSIKAGTPYDLGQIQAMRALSQKMTFYTDYFVDPAGRADARRLGFDGLAADAIAARLLDVPRITQSMPSDELKQIASRSGQWAQARLVEVLAQPADNDTQYAGASRLIVNYSPDKILQKAHALRAYLQFFDEAAYHLQTEPDNHLAEANHALLTVYRGRVKALAATDVFPALLSLEDQLAKSGQNQQSQQWGLQLAQVAPAIGRIGKLTGDDRLTAREYYAQHLDAIRQGAPFNLDDIDGQAAIKFSRKALSDIITSIKQLVANSSNSPQINLATRYKDVVWGDEQIKQFVQAVLAKWGMLSEYPATWQDTDGRNGFAPDGKFQVVITPHRNNMSVDSTRRIINIPADYQRPLINAYPAGALPLIAHELSHVLQAYADHDLGNQIPLARIKGRRYRILREAGGAYQERIIMPRLLWYGGSKTQRPLSKCLHR